MPGRVDSDQQATARPATAASVPPARGGRRLNSDSQGLAESDFLMTTLLRSVRFQAVAAAALGLLCLWAYWPTLCVMASSWTRDAQYSHGYLVPAFAAVLLWLRRDRLKGVTFRLAPWALLLLLAAAVVRALASYWYVEWFDGGSLLLTVAGLFALFGGRRALRWAWPVTRA